MKGKLLRLLLELLTPTDPKSESRKDEHTKEDVVCWPGLVPRVRVKRSKILYSTITDGSCFQNFPCLQTLELAPSSITGELNKDMTIACYNGIDHWTGADRVGRLTLGHKKRDPNVTKAGNSRKKTKGTKKYDRNEWKQKWENEYPWLRQDGSYVWCHWCHTYPALAGRDLIAIKQQPFKSIRTDRITRHDSNAKHEKCKQKYQQEQKMLPSSRRSQVGCLFHS